VLGRDIRPEELRVLAAAAAKPAASQP